MKKHSKLSALHQGVKPQRRKVRGPRPAGGVGSAPPVSGKAPKPAAWLSEGAHKIFADLISRLDDAGGASETHEEALNLCAMALDEVRALSDILNRDGTTYECRKVFPPREEGGDPLVIVTGYRARPEYAQRADASNRARALLIELGLTPAARNRVKGGPKSGKGGGGAFDDV
jgi:P27 family predicted phage terminase small subunit